MGTSTVIFLIVFTWWSVALIVGYIFGKKRWFEGSEGVMATIWPILIVVSPVFVIYWVAEKANAKARGF